MLPPSPGSPRYVGVVLFNDAALYATRGIDVEAHAAAAFDVVPAAAPKSSASTVGVSAAYPRRGRGVAATRLRERSPRNNI